MPLTSLAVIGVTILLSSFISGTFGMAGGMVLLGVLLIYFPVSAAMVLFSLIQFASNGWRAVLWWRFVLWPIFFPYVAGAMVAFGALRLIAYVPDKATVYVVLGLLPFAVEILPDSFERAIEVLLFHIAQRHLVAAAREHVGDAVTHGPRSDHSHAFNGHRR